MEKLNCPETVTKLAVKRAGLIRTSELKDASIGSHPIKTMLDNRAATRPVRGLLILKDAAEQSRRDLGEYQFQRLQAAYAGVMSSGPTAAAAAKSALIILGAQGLPKTIQPEITLQKGGATKHDSLFRNLREPYQQSHQINGVKVLPATLALAQSISTLPRNNAIAVMDSMLHLKLLDAAGLNHAQQPTRNRPGAVKARPWWRLADGRADSPAESFARLTCTDLGCPPDGVQVQVLDSYGFFIGRVDLAWRLPDARWLLGEVDGFDYHSSAKQLQADRSRQNQLVGPHTILRRWSGTEAFNSRMAAEVRSLLNDARWRPGQVKATDAQIIQL